VTPQDTLKRYEAGLNQRSWDAIAEFVSEDAVFWFTSGSHQGHAAIRAACERTWASIPEERYWLDKLVWIAASDAAASCIYRFNWTGMVDGKPVAGNGRGTTVLRKQGDRWLIVHEHLSRFPPTPD